MKFLNEILDYNAQLRHFLSYLPFESILLVRSEKNIVPQYFSYKELPQLKYSVRNLCSGYQCDSVLHNMQSLRNI